MRRSHVRYWLTALGGLTGLAGCAMSPVDGGPSHPVDLSAITEPVPRLEPRSRYGNPESYVVNGHRYHVMEDSEGYVEQGIASWYGTKFHGRRTSSGEPYDMFAMTGAHRSLPLPTYVRVTNLENRKSVVVRVNDRGPFHDERIIDLSYAAATRIGIADSGTARVEVRALVPEAATTATEPAVTPVAVAEPADWVVAAANWEMASGKLQKAPAETPAESSVYLQVGAFTRRENAERLRKRLAALAIDNVLIHEIGSDQDTVYRVRIGPLADTSSADELTRIIVGSGGPAPRLVTH